jgi:hypothetical protein
MTRGRKPVNGDIAADIARRYERGSTTTQIANYLNAADTPSAQGGRWFPSTINRILRRQGVALRPGGRPRKETA